MKTITIAPEKMAVQELFGMAKNESLLVKIKDGDSFFISLADDFNSEVELLRNHHRFLSMLDQFKQEKETISFEDVEKMLR